MLGGGVFIYVLDLDDPLNYLFDITQYSFYCDGFFFFLRLL